MENLQDTNKPVAFRLKSETVDYQVTCYCKEQADIYINDMGWQLIEVLYTTPPQRTWVGLTNEQYLEACKIAEGGNYMVAFQRIQQWLMENNE